MSSAAVMIGALRVKGQIPDLKKFCLRVGLILVGVNNRREQTVTVVEKHGYLPWPTKTAADDIYKYFFVSEKIRLDVSNESSARQRIHMKNQVVFFSKDKSKKLKCRLLQFLFGAFRVKLQSWLNGG